MEDRPHPILIYLCPQRLDGADELVGIREKMGEEIENQVTRAFMVGVIHGHFTEIVAQFRIDDGECSQAIPQVIQDENSLCLGAGGLIVQADERASQFHRVGQDLLDKPFREIKEMSRGQDRLALRIETHIRSAQEAIASQDLLLFRAPYNQLPIGVLHRVELINIDLFARTPAIIAESDLSQASNLLHHMWGVVGGYDINLVARLVGATKPFLWCQLGFQQCFFYRWNNLMLVHVCTYFKL